MRRDYHAASHDENISSQNTTLSLSSLCESICADYHIIINYYHHFHHHIIYHYFIIIMQTHIITAGHFTLRKPRYIFFFYAAIITTPFHYHATFRFHFSTLSSSLFSADIIEKTHYFHYFSLFTHHYFRHIIIPRRTSFLFITTHHRHFCGERNIIILNILRRTFDICAEQRALFFFDRAGADIIIFTHYRHLPMQRCIIIFICNIIDWRRHLRREKEKNIIIFSARREESMPNDDHHFLPFAHRYVSTQRGATFLFHHRRERGREERGTSSTQRE